MIWLNFLRDLKGALSRLVSVILITAIAVTVYIALSSITYNVRLICSTYYESQNVADYWITGTGLDRADCRTLAALPGVTGVQPRITLEAQEKNDTSITLALYAVPDSYAINTPYLVEGALPASSRQMVLSDEFARANGLSVGDWYEITLTGINQVLRLQISGLVKSPELMRHVTATTPAADLAHYGFAYLNDTALSALMGPNRYNQICLTVKDDTSGELLRRQIDDALGDRVINVLALEDSLAAYSFQSTTDDLQPVLNLFPILFFLCAILLMVRNMSRLIENARQEIGTFKALGYYDTTILGYYLLHAVVVVLVGFPLGVLPTRPLIRLIVDTLATGCDLPAYTVAHDYSSWAEAFVITAVCCIGSAWWVARAMLKERPAECMRPKPPKSTKPVFLEGIPALWQRLSFNQKYIIRNTLRNKARMLTCIVGIAFCMALVVAAFGLRDAVIRYTDALTSNQNRYDLIASLNRGVEESQYRRLADSPHAAQAEFEMTTACWFYSGRQLTTAALTVAEDTPALRLYDPYAPGPQPLPERGLVLEENTAKTLEISEGDVVYLRFSGNTQLYPVPVARIERCVSGAYISRSLWRSMGLPYTPTTAYLRSADAGALQSELNRYDFVDSWQTREAVTDAAADSLSSASLVAYILILFGGGLACVVIYNLGIMSFFEQIRALATLMVLGFYDQEIRRLQLSENIIFTIGGILLGLPAGVALTHFFVHVLKNLPLMVSTKPLSYVLSCAVTLLFALAVNAMIGRKMRDIDMLGALKSVE